MRLLDFIFELIRRFVPIGQQEWADLRHEAENDVAKYSVNDENKFKSMYAKYNNKWQFRTLLAVLFIPFTRSIANYMNPRNEEDED